MKNTLTIFAIIVFSVSISAQLQFVERSDTKVNPRESRTVNSDQPSTTGKEENYVRLNNLGVSEARINGDFVAAGEYFKQALESQPGCFICRYNLGRSFIATNQYSDAHGIFERLVREDPKSAGALSSLGEVLSLLGDDPGAIPLLEKSLDLDPNDAITLNNYGISLHNTQNFKKALKAFDQAIAIQPNMAEAHNYRGITLYQLGKKKKALKSLRRADSLQPNVAEVKNNLGVVLEKLGKKKQALSHYLEAVKIRPNFGNAVFNLALIYIRIGKRDEAQKQLKSLEKFDALLARELRKVLWGKYVVDASAARFKN